MTPEPLGSSQDLSKQGPDQTAELKGRSPATAVHYPVLIIGAGTAGISVASSLLWRRPGLEIAIVEPAQQHYYQPGWTLVGAGVFTPKQTERQMASLMPAGLQWIQNSVSEFVPESNQVLLADGQRLSYDLLIVATGLKLDWAAVEGLPETLGKNGVTSNYRFDLASYTWSLVQQLESGTALFTQPPMPIKCAGAPQKAMYLSCDYWQKAGRLNKIQTEFCLAGDVLFSVKDFIPALMEYVERYHDRLSFGHNLTAIDGPGHKAWFSVAGADGAKETVEKSFDLIHVVPPQTAPDEIRSSPLASAAGWVEVSAETLQHSRYANVFSLGDVCSTPNAKTAAAVRKQAPVVAENALAVLDGKPPRATYDGYGCCPLTVERGKVILAEFGYGGKLQPTFPGTWTSARAEAWWMKTTLFPWVYWNLVLKGREVLAEPKLKA
jgi:sulfide:quinone oxidoreductase